MAAAQPGAQPAAPAVSNPELAKRQVELTRQLAQLQWDLGGLVYEMAIRDHFRLDLVVRQAAELQAVDAELGAVERMLRMEQAGAAGKCPKCGALYPRGAVFCWQCGNDLMQRAPVGGDAPQSTQPTAETAQPAAQGTQPATETTRQSPEQTASGSASEGPPGTRPPGAEGWKTSGEAVPGWGTPERARGQRTP
jgi:hypothetical protein